MKEKRASLAGIILREAIRTGVRMRRSRGGLMRAGTAYAAAKSGWRAPKGWKLEKFRAGCLPLELLTSARGREDLAVLQLHGGAYQMGYTDMYRRFSLRYSRLCGDAPVLSVDYRTAPEHRFPAALEDALAAWTWMLENGCRAERILVVGDSAGGNLALALTLKLRELGCALPGALVLLSPWTDMTGEGESRKFNYPRDPMFGESAGGLGANAYAGGADLHDPYLSPAFAEYEGFPPMLLQAGTWEMLLSDSRTVAEKAAAAGVDVTLTEYAGMFHVFQLFGSLIPESRAAWREVARFIRAKFPAEKASSGPSMAVPPVI